MNRENGDALLMPRDKGDIVHQRNGAVHRSIPDHLGYQAASQAWWSSRTATGAWIKKRWMTVNRKRMAIVLEGRAMA